MPVPMFRKIRRRVRALFQASELDSELAEEIRLHVEFETEELMHAEGLSHDEARRRAMAAFGGVQRTREAHRDVRGVRWVEQLGQDVKYAVRSLRKSPGFVAATVLTLALGIGVTTAVYSVADRLMIRSLPFAHAERLGLFAFRQPNGTLVHGVPAQLLFDWENTARSFDEMSVISNHGGFLEAAGQTTVVAGHSVAPSLLRALGVVPVLGRNFVPADTLPGVSPVIMLSERFWRSRFHGASNVVGMPVSLNDTTYTVIGVVPEALDAIERYAPMDFWMPMYPAQTAKLSTTANSVYGIARVKPGVTRARADRELGLLFQRYARSRGWKGTPVLPAPVLVAPSALLPHELGIAIWTLFGATLLVLLIACANVANLQLVRARRRAMEFAIRSALGARRLRLVRQLLIEAIGIAVVSAFGGIAIAWAVLRVTRAYHPVQLVQLNVLGLDHVDLAISLLLTAGTCLAIGIVPAWLMTGDRIGGLLRGVSATGQAYRRSRLQTGIVVTEIALSVALLLSAGVLTRAFVRLNDANPGFRPAGLVEMMIYIPPASYADSAARAGFWQRVLSRAAAVPGVERVERATPSMLWANAFVGQRVQLQPGGVAAASAPSEVADVRSVTAGYFALTGASMVAGRPFTQAEARDPHASVVILGSGVARRLWPNESALGKTVRLTAKGALLTVVGVVADMGVVGPDASAHRLQIYRPAAVPPGAFDFGAPGLMARTFPGAPVPQVLAALQQVVRSVDPSVAVNNAKSDVSILGDRLARPRFNSAVMGIFSVASLLLAALGLYGVIAYVVAQRSHEFGVRMALGAGPGTLQRMVLRDGAVLALVGIAVGIPCGLAGVHLLRSILYGVDPNDPVVFVAVPAMLLAVTLLAAYLPARRAARVDPVIALKSE